LDKEKDLQKNIFWAYLLFGLRCNRCQK